MQSVLNKMNIRTGSVVWAVQDIGEHYTNLSKAQYEELIVRLTGVEVTTADTLSAEITFKYIVQGIIQNMSSDVKRDMLDIINEAVVKSDKLIAENGYTMRMARNPVSGEEHLDGSTAGKKVTHKSGPSKSDQANNVIEQNKLLGKPATIDLLVSILSISKQNALVYYYKWNKQQEGK